MVLRVYVRAANNEAAIMYTFNDVDYRIDGNVLRISDMALGIETIIPLASVYMMQSATNAAARLEAPEGAVVS